MLSNGSGGSKRTTIYDTDPVGTDPANAPVFAGDRGYFAGENDDGRARDPIPMCWLRIIPRDGQYYWHFDYLYRSAIRCPDDFSLCVFYIKDSEAVLTGRTVDYCGLGEIVWEFPVSKTDVDAKKGWIVEKIISEQYFNGYFYARSKVDGEFGPPTALLSIPEYDFVIPDKIRAFTISEDPTYVEGSAQVYSNITVQYTPPDDTNGFWGVALYIEGYQDNDQPRLLQMREFNPEFNGYGDDTFQCVLEPWAPVVLQNKYSGKINCAAKNVSSMSHATQKISFATNHGFFVGQEIVYHNGGGASFDVLGTPVVDGTTFYAIPIGGEPANMKIASTMALAKAGTALHICDTSSGTAAQFFSYNTTQKINYGDGSVARFLRKDFLSSTQRGVFYTVDGNYDWVSPDWSTYEIPDDGYRFNNNSGGSAEVQNPVRMGDTLSCAGNSTLAIGSTFLQANPDTASPNKDNVEAIIMHSGDETDAFKEGKLTALCISSTVSDATENICYGNWKIYRSCKFYLVSVNRSGYHGPLADNALTQYCALDGLPSAPPVVQDPKARQYATKNSITWAYSGILVEDVKSFNVFRSVNDGNIRMIASVSARTQANENPYTNAIKTYGYDDAELYNTDASENYGTIDAAVKYFVSVVDKADSESAMKQCQHYDIDGNLADSIGHRRHAGVDTGVMVVARNNSFNLLWNSECNWDATNPNIGTPTKGVGQCPAFEWALTNTQNNGGTTYGYSNFYSWPQSAPYNLDLYWDGNAGYKYFYVTGSGAASLAQFQAWFMRLSRATTLNAAGNGIINDYPTETTTVGRATYAGLGLGKYFADDVFTGVVSGRANISTAGIGRAKICIPAIGYIGHISWVAINKWGIFPFNYALIFGVNDYEPPFPDAAITTLTSTSGGRAHYYLSMPIEDNWYHSGAPSSLYCPPYTVAYDDEQVYHRNGWTFIRNPYPSGYVAQSWTNGQIDVLPSATSDTSIYHDYDVSLNNYSGYLTLSLQVKRSAGTATTGTMKFFMNLLPNTRHPYLIQNGTVFPGTSFSLSEITSAYQYFVVYFYLGSSPAYSNYKMARAIVQFIDQGSTTTYSIMKPMLNIGSEAAPYTSMIPQPLSWRLSPFTNLPESPEQPSEHDPQCIAFGQDVMLGNGETVKVEELKHGSILRGWFQDADVKFNVHVRSVVHSAGETRLIKLIGGYQMEVTDEHTCVMDGCLKAARDVIPGEKMLVYHDGFTHKKVKVISNCPTGETKEIVKLECSYPHTLYLNRILTHNMKTGERG